MKPFKLTSLFIIIKSFGALNYVFIIYLLIRNTLRNFRPECPKMCYCHVRKIFYFVYPFTLCPHSFNFCFSGVQTNILNEKKQAVIHLATELNKVTVLEVMSRHKDKIDIQQGGEHGRTALHIAAIYDHEQCAKILVRISLWSQQYTSVLQKKSTI